MRKALAVLGSLVFLVIAPGIVAGYVPRAISHWRMLPAFFGIPSLRIVGAALIGVGAIVLLDSFARFAFEGLGTPAPIAPPQKLVVTGWYQYVRNPMYVAVLAAIFGQGIFFGNTDLLVYGAVVWIGFYFFVVLYEEPALQRKFPEDYPSYRDNVPRFIPRIKAWKQP